MHAHLVAKGLVRLAAEAGVQSALLAVARVTRHSGVRGPIISARPPGQLAAPPARDRLEEA